jgi:hypothetical protein
MDARDDRLRSECKWRGGGAIQIDVFTNEQAGFGLMHTFWNAGPGPARLLEGPRRASDEWVAELTSRYNLKLLCDQDARCGATRVGALWSRQPA